MPDIRLQSTPSNGSTVARIYCNNNNYNGFSLTFVRSIGPIGIFKNNEYPVDEKDGHFIGYTLDLIQGETGQLGIDMPPEVERKGFTLYDPYIIYFNDNVQEATYDARVYFKNAYRKKSLIISWCISRHHHSNHYRFVSSSNENSLFYRYINDDNKWDDVGWHFWKNSPKGRG